MEFFWVWSRNAGLNLILKKKGEKGEESNSLSPRFLAKVWLQPSFKSNIFRAVFCRWQLYLRAYLNRYLAIFQNKSALNFRKLCSFMHIPWQGRALWLGKLALLSMTLLPCSIPAHPSHGRPDLGFVSQRRFAYFCGFSQISTCGCIDVKLRCVTVYLRCMKHCIQHKVSEVTWS